MRDGNRYIEIQGEAEHDLLVGALLLLGYDVGGSNITIEVHNPDRLLTSLVNRLEREHECRFVNRPDHWRPT